MRDLLKLLWLYQEIQVSMKIEVKLRLLKYCNKFKLSKINLIKREDLGIL